MNKANKTSLWIILGCGVATIILGGVFVLVMGEIVGELEKAGFFDKFAEWINWPKD